MSKNPFQPAEKIAKKLKVLIYGASGSGKTRAALTFPGVAVIDTENGTDLYAGRPGVSAFSVLRAKTLSEVEEAVKFIREDNGKTFQTLVIDAITVLYDVQKEAAAKQGKDGEMNPRLWNRVNGRMVALYNSLINLPTHVVVIAREAELYEGEGLNLKRTGFKADADKKIPYLFDFVVRMTADHSGQIIKSRGTNLTTTMPTVNWEAFEKAAGLFTDGVQMPVLSDETAVERDATAYVESAPATPAPRPSQAVSASAASAPAAPLSSNDESRWPTFLTWTREKFNVSETGILDILEPFRVNGVITVDRDTALGYVLAKCVGYDASEICNFGHELKLSDAVIAAALRAPAPEIPF
jgi:energy-coupling factor transporter ATP-binding protein EcfA2